MTLATQDPVHWQVVDGLRLQAASFAVQRSVLPDFVDLPSEVLNAFFTDYFPQLFRQGLIPESARNEVNAYVGFVDSWEECETYEESLDALQHGQWFEELRSRAARLLQAIGEECYPPNLDRTTLVSSGTDSSPAVVGSFEAPPRRGLATWMGALSGAVVAMVAWVAYVVIVTQEFSGPALSFAVVTGAVVGALLGWMITMRDSRNDEIRGLLINIISDGFNRSIAALEQTGAIETSEMRREYRGVGSKYYDVVTAQIELTATHGAETVRRVLGDGRRVDQRLGDGVGQIMDDDPVHPIIERPHEYSIADMRYHVGLDGTEPYVDLDLHKGSVVRRLRFWSPQQFAIEEGCFPHPTSGMVIQDVRSRGLEGLGVRVADFEGTHGTITFWAREVVDLDKQADSWRTNWPGEAPTGLLEQATSEVYSNPPAHLELPRGLSLQRLHDDDQGLRVVLEDQNGTGAVYIIRFDSHVAYRNIDEGDRLASLPDLTGGQAIMSVDSSVWLEWFAAESCGKYDTSELTHWAIITPNDWVDVISLNPPTLKCLTSGADS